MKWPSLSNCHIEAMRLWLLTRMRSIIWVRRSLHYRGVVPHFGTAHKTGLRQLQLVEFIPPKKGKSKIDVLVLFDGCYRVWELRLVKRKRFRTLDEVVRYLHKDGDKDVGTELERDS